MSELLMKLEEDKMSTCDGCPMEGRCPGYNGNMCEDRKRKEVSMSRYYTGREVSCARVGLTRTSIEGGTDLLTCGCGNKAGYRVDKEKHAELCPPWYKRDSKGVLTKASEGGRFCQECAEKEWKHRASKYGWKAIAL